MMKLKNIGKRTVKVGPDSLLHPGDEININDTATALYILRKHSELANVTPKRVKPIKKKNAKDIEVKEIDIE